MDGSRSRELSEYSRQTGVVYEGWLEKKSRTTGFWLKRYFVLNESTRDCFVLRSYCKAIETAWGEVPEQLKSEIPISNIMSVGTVASKYHHEFTISLGHKSGIDDSGSVTSSRSAQSKAQLSSSGLTLNAHHNVTSNGIDDNANMMSGAAVAASEIDEEADECIKIIKLRAPDPEVSLLSY